MKVHFIENNLILNNIQTKVIFYSPSLPGNFLPAEKNCLVLYRFLTVQISTVCRKIFLWILYNAYFKKSAISVAKVLFLY